MIIKSATTTEGMPIKIKPFSPEMLATECGKDAFQDILSNRIQAFYDSYRYMKQHEDFRALYSEIVSKDPELKKLMNKIDSLVVAKETDCFDAGYKAGMADLMTALTLNNLQITQTSMIDMEAIDSQRRASDVA